MAFHIQDPGNLHTTYLVEVLAQSCVGASSGGGFFAWASRRGLHLLFRNELFSKFLSKGEFELVVGTDSITDVKAVNELVDLQSAYPLLTVKIFVNQYSATIFHPKFCWFKVGSAGVLVAGSGNLTEGGLSRNWEAFTVSSLDKGDLANLLDQWNAWQAAYQSDLLDVASPLVTARVKLNIWTPPKHKAKAKPLLHLAKPGLKPAKKLASASPVNAGVSDVLIAEVPRASTRWNQVNFDLNTYETYFGAKVGTTRYMFLRHVKPNGDVDDTETRPSVAVKSSNYRFELSAARGLAYPSKHRPIVVFLRQAARNFLYQLLMPGTSGYSKASSLLNAHWKGSVGRVRRITLARATVEASWPHSPLWNADQDKSTEL